MGGNGDGGAADGGAAESGAADSGAAESGAADGGAAESGAADSGAAESGADGGPVDGGVPGGGSGDSPAGEPLGDGGPRDQLGGAVASPASGNTHSASGASAAAEAGPAELLAEVRAVRRRARLARHAYWFPLVLFGLLTCASLPFYFPPTRSGTYSRPPGPRFLQSAYLGGFGIASYRGTAYYWLGAMLLGIAATVFWYRSRGNRVGLRTPARGYLITGLIIVALALLIPLAGGDGGMPLIMPGDLLGRGTFPFVLIGLGLCFLAWAERSVGLTVIATAYLALALVASLYDIQNVFYNWLGWSLGPTASSLPNVVLPALVLLLSGAGAWAVQRRHRPPQPEAADG
jgi:hypothetical protein